MANDQSNYKAAEAAALLSPTLNGGKAMEDFGASNSKSYPSAEAEYDEIVRNADVFFDKLKHFHSSFGTKLSCPKLGGQTLDLQRLFVEVTSRGGFDKIVGDRKWKEVVSTFNFPETATSGSFLLRKHYLSLLYHFEQVYFFRKRLAITSLSVPKFQSSNSAVPTDQSPNTEADGSGEQITHDGMPMDTANFSVRPGITVVGTIDSKFDDGYVVTIKFGSEELKGILYHTPEANPETRIDTKASTQSALNPDIPKTRRRRRRKRLNGRDPLKPKQNRNSYNFFFAEHYARLKPMYHGRERAISKRIADLWSNLSESEKRVYREKGDKDKERYQTEMSEYKSSTANPPK